MSNAHREGPPDEAGCLVLVATPIGNLGDISVRATSTLSRADVICCEDTRRTRELLAYLGIRSKSLLSLNEHNESARIPSLLSRIASGETVALVSDAGTPGVSDPGSRLVRSVAGQGSKVTIVPGPSAPVAALVVSGLDTERFCFEGFLPRKGAERRRRLEQLAREARTTLILEAPTRLSSTLADLVSVCGGRRTLAVARELTKLHEEIWRGDLDEAAGHFSSRPARGEIVIVLEGVTEDRELSDESVRAALRERMKEGDSVRDAAAAAADALSVSRRRAYELALEIRQLAEDASRP